MGSPSCLETPSSHGELSVDAKSFMGAFTTAELSKCGEHQQWWMHAAFPAGTVSGASKIRAMQIISEPALWVNLSSGFTRALSAFIPRGEKARRAARMPDAWATSASTAIWTRASPSAPPCLRTAKRMSRLEEGGLMTQSQRVSFKKPSTNRRRC